MPRPSRTPGRAGGRYAAGLRIATHNVRGLLGAPGQGKVEGLVDLWFRDLNLHMVLLQEVHITSAQRCRCHEVEQRAAAQLESRSLDSGLRWLWTPAGQGGNACGGTAIVVRQSVLASGRLRIVGPPTQTADGRLLHVKVKWGALDFVVASAYLPSGDPAGQRAFLRDRVAPLMAACRGRLLLGGDFNFTPDPGGLDRARPGAGPRSWTAEGATAAAMAQLCVDHSMVDVERRHHPGARRFTYRSATSQALARLDRWYAPEAAMAHCHA